MSDPIPQYTHFISELKAAHPDLAYLHVVEPEAAGRAKDIPESNDFIRQIWSPKPLITAGGYTRETAITRTQQNDNELIAFGKLYISNVSPLLDCFIVNGTPTEYWSLTFSLIFRPA